MDAPNTQPGRRKEITVSSSLSLMLLLLLLPLPPVALSGSEMCAAVTTLDSTVVTCYFGRYSDLSTRDFNVQFFYPNRSADPEVTLACNRLDSGKLKCHKAVDVTFDEGQDMDDRFSLWRPPSKNLQGGQYLCQLVPHRGEAAQYCTLVSALFPEPPVTTSGDDLALSLLTAIAIITLLLVAVVLVIVCVVIHLKRKRLMKWWSKHDTVESPAPKDQHNASESTRPQTGDTTEPLLISSDHFGSGQQTKDEKTAAVPEQMLDALALRVREQPRSGSRTAVTSRYQKDQAAAGEKSRNSGADIECGEDALGTPEGPAPVKYLTPNASQSPRRTMEPHRIPQVELQLLAPEPGEQEEAYHDTLEELDASISMLKGDRFQSETERKKADKKFKEQQADDLNSYKQNQGDEMRRLEERLQAENKPSGEIKKARKKLEELQKKERKEFEEKQTTKNKQWEKYQKAESKRLSQEAKDLKKSPQK